MRYGALFITGTNKPTARLMTNELANDIEYSVIWKGTKTGKRDRILTECDKEIHVFGRTATGVGFTYYGIVDNDSMEEMTKQRSSVPHAQGDATNYFFRLHSDNVDEARLPIGHVCAVDDAQNSAISELGLCRAPDTNHNVLFELFVIEDA
jgi:hypothetical protein